MTEKLNAWCVVELMGHVTLAGFVSEQEIAGAALIRIDVPETETGPGFSKLVGPSSIYGITPVDEETVRTICAEGSQRPFSAWELQSAFDKYYRRRLDLERPGIEEQVRRALTQKGECDDSCSPDDDAIPL